MDLKDVRQRKTKENKDKGKEERENDKAKKQSKKSKKGKPTVKVSPQKERKRERRKERRTEKNTIESTHKLIKLKNKVLQFCREHLLIVALSATAFLLLVALNYSVDPFEERHPSKHPNVTDHVTFDINIEKGPPGRLVFGLYGKDCPLTVKNFIQLVNHDQGYGYTDSILFKIVKHHLILGGDIVSNNGSGGRSALDESFEGENLKLHHKIRGTLGMLPMKNNDDSRLTSQFYISLGDLSHFDGNSVIIGHLLEGLHYLDLLERAPTDEEMRPRTKITIAKTSHKVVSAE